MNSDQLARRAAELGLEKKAHDVLKEQCEDFLFGGGGQAPAEYVPVAETKD